VTSFIHEAAYVNGSEVGDNTKVWQFASVIRGAKIGKNCTIGDCAIIDGAIIGDNVLVGHGAFIGPGVRVGNNVFVAPNVTMCNDAWPRVSKTGWHLDQFLADFITIIIEDGASIGAGAILLPGVVIGAGSMVAGGAVVGSNVPPNSLFKRSGSYVMIDTSIDSPRMKRAQS